MLITAADPRAASLSLALRPLDLLTPAHAAGWANPSAAVVPELHRADVLLRIGSQRLPVRQVANGPDAAAHIEQVAASLLPAVFPEQYLVLQGFSSEDVARIRARFRRPGFRFLVGTFDEYQVWLNTRLGPLGCLGHDSPVRQLTERLLCFSRKPSPTQRVPAQGNFTHSGIRREFELGSLGVQALSTILMPSMGADALCNVEGVVKWQKKDVDLLVQGCVGGQPGPVINTEVKAEAYDTGNYSLEDYGNFEARIKGWLHYSDASVLVSIAWPTGDLVLTNFKKIQSWVLSGKHNLRKTYGSTKNQPYRSLIWLAPVTTLLQTFEDTVYLRIDEFSPLAYRDQFKTRSIVPACYASRKLVPQRPE
jgi:hypothetical protein